MRKENRGLRYRFTAILCGQQFPPLIRFYNDCHQCEILDKIGKYQPLIDCCDDGVLMHATPESCRAGYIYCRLNFLCSFSILYHLTTIKCDMNMDKDFMRLL